MVGDGGQCRSLAGEVALFADLEVFGFLDDSMPASETMMGMPLLGPSTIIGSYRYLIISEYEKSF